VSKWGGGKGVVPKASGGDITYVYSQGKLQAVHTFNDTGTFTPLEAIDVEYLIIAGGGGGGGNSGVGGGGGAGGYRSSVSGENSGGGSSAESRASLVAGTSYTITVGGGGA